MTEASVTERLTEVRGGDAAMSGIFVIAEVRGEAGERIREIQRTFDPKLASSAPPHITLAGSSGVGPMHVAPVDELRAALAPIAATTSPLSVRFEAPMRFMQTMIIVLPIDPNGPLRVLHDRIATSGLTFESARFTFTPHCTLSFYREHSKRVIREILALRVNEPAIVDRLGVYRSQDPQPPELILELELSDGGDRRSSHGERRRVEG